MVAIMINSSLRKQELQNSSSPNSKQRGLRVSLNAPIKAQKLFDIKIIWSLSNEQSKNKKTLQEAPHQSFVPLLEDLIGKRLEGMRTQILKVQALKLEKSLKAGDQKISETFRLVPSVKKIEVYCCELFSKVEKTRLP